MSADLDSAALLVTTCSRCTFDDTQKAELHTILEQGVDWKRVLALAEKNYVVPLLFESLQGDVASLVPAPVYEQLTAQRRFLKFRAELFCDELVRLSRLLDDAQIPVLHYKGPVASDMLYGNRYRRTYFDLDFLVRRDQLERVSALLRSEGYKCNVDLTDNARDRFEQDQKEYTFVSGLLCIEPHWSLTARRYPFPVDYAKLWERAAVHRFGDAGLLTFSPRDMLLILSVAGAKGHWKRLQMVTDVAQFYRTTVPDLAAGVLDDAQALGCERIVLVGAHLASVLLNAPLPDAVATRIRADRRAVEAISREVVRRLFEEARRTTAFGTSPHIFSPLLYAMRERPRDRIRYLVQTTTAPTALHLSRFSLPKWAYPAYRLIVPMHDYALMPLVYTTRRYLSRRRGA